MERRAPQARAFGQFKEVARRYLNDDRAGALLANEAEVRLDEIRSGPLLKVAEDARTLLRLLRMFSGGTYRDISWENMVLVVAGLLYVVDPREVIPDALPGGYSDDAIVLSFVVSLVRSELDDFLEWERTETR